MSNSVELCRKKLSENIVEGRQHFLTAFFASIRQNFLSNVVEYCLKMLSKTAVEEFDSTVRQNLQKKLGQSSLKIVELWRSFASTKFDKEA